MTVQHWSSNVFNLVTKRGLAHEDAEIKWIDCNIGSRLTMKYPGVIMKGRKARGEVLSIALANDGQHQDTGAKMIHAADETTSNITSEQNGGQRPPLQQSLMAKTVTRPSLPSPAQSAV